jgi:two-component system, cell cycle response regulator
VKILVAEDSATSRLLLTRELVRLGHESIVAEDGAQAWDMFRGSDVEVVISDWMMPGMNGDELCRLVRSQPSAPYTYFVILTSLEGRGHVVQGMRAGADDYLTKPFDNEQLEACLIGAARVSALHRRVAEQQVELERLNVGLFADSRRDHLTGLGNRLRQDEDLDALTSRAERYGQSFCVALLDIDHFKGYNDTCGHLAGDEVLRRIAQVLVDERRRGDAVYRYGGEELLVVLPAQDLDSATIAVERMRTAVEALAIPHPGIKPVGVVTVSAGVAERRANKGGDAEELLHRADAALYNAKRAGRNRVVTELVNHTSAA